MAERLRANAVDWADKALPLPLAHRSARVRPSLPRTAVCYSAAGYDGVKPCSGSSEILEDVACRAVKRAGYARCCRRGPLIRRDVNGLPRWGRPLENEYALWILTFLSGRGMIVLMSTLHIHYSSILLSPQSSIPVLTSGGYVWVAGAARLAWRRFRTDS